MVALNRNKMQLEIVCTSLSRNKPVVVYYNLYQNVCNHKFPATKKLEKRSSSFPEALFLRDMRNTKKISSSFPEVFSREFLRNVNGSRNRIFPEYYLTLFQIVLLLSIIPNSVKISTESFLSEATRKM